MVNTGLSTIPLPPFLTLSARRGRAEMCALWLAEGARRTARPTPGGLLRGGRFVRLSAATGARFCVSVGDRRPPLHRALMPGSSFRVAVTT